MTFHVVLAPGLGVRLTAISVVGEAPPQAVAGAVVRWLLITKDPLDAESTVGVCLQRKPLGFEEPEGPARAAGHEEGTR